MRKSLITVLAILGALVFCGQAQAQYELNLWGASAQFQLYDQSMVTFLSGAPYSCTTTHSSDGSKYSITIGTGCASPAAGATITVRVTSKASYDGVFALEGNRKDEDAAAAQYATGSGLDSTSDPNPFNFCDPSAANPVGSAWPVGALAAGAPDCCPDGFPLYAGDTCPNGDTCNYYYRVMSDSTANATAVTSYNCKRVDGALSDVWPLSLIEQMNTPPGYVGNATHPPVYGGNAKDFSGTNGTNAIDPVALAGFQNWNPMAVPFGFYASTDVQYFTCAGGVNQGQQCTAGSNGANMTDCFNSVAPAAGTSCDCPNDSPDTGVYSSCSNANLSNISRLQAIEIFTRKATKWTDLGQGYQAGGSSTTPITACYRVPGSGSNVTLHQSVLDWGGASFNGGSMPIASSYAAASGGAIFNDGTGDTIKCVNNGAAINNHTASLHGLLAQAATTGLIGYADCDQALDMAPLATLGTIQGHTTNKYPYIQPLMYEGMKCSRRAIRNGEYDNFYSKEWVFADYTSPSSDFNAAGTGAGLQAIMNNLMAKLSTPAGISATDRKDFWAAIGETNEVYNSGVNQEMYYLKSGTGVNDKNYPAGKLAPFAPQTP
jgi:hypothetical protein